MWGIEGGIAETYVEDNLWWARRQSTRYWIRELKRYQHHYRHKPTMLSARHDMEESRFRLALAILKERRSPEVLAVLREIGAQNPYYSVKVEMLRAIEDCMVYS